MRTTIDQGCTVSIVRPHYGDGKELIKIEARVGCKRLCIEMLPGEFALALTGLAEVPARFTQKEPPPPLSIK